MNRFAAKYRDRGLVVLALQVRRPPDVFAENNIYWLQFLKPTFPVFRLGWNPEWPTRTLPFTFLFDHEGNEVFAGKPERMESAIVKALDAAPDHMIGGPYETQKALAATIVADRAKLGTHLARLRTTKDPDPEIRAMIGAAERWFARRTARIEEYMPGVVEQAEAWDALAKTFEGDRLVERAAKARDALRSAETYAAEEAAETVLREARATFRRCPPRGGYFPYHFTKMLYTVKEEDAWVARRMRMHVELRLELKRIADTYPDTHAAGEADYLMIQHDLPELSEEAAREQVARAERMMGEGSPTAALYEARLVLIEVRDGYYGADEISTRAKELLATIRKDRAKDLAAAEEQARALHEEADRLQESVLEAGSLLSQETAAEITTRLKDVAKRSGEESVLARRIAEYVAALAKSFEGTPLVGIRLDRRFAGPGVRLGGVDPGTGAAKAGLEPGDVVLKIGETALKNLNDFPKALSEKKPGQTVRLEVKRASGEVEVLDLLLGRRLRTRRSHFPR